MALAPEAPLRNARGAGRRHRALAGRRAGLGPPRAVAGAGPPLARRHRSLVTGAAVALIVALLALGGSLAHEAQTNRQLRLAHAREVRAREQAQSRFALARDAIARYYRGVSEDVLLRRTEFRELRRSLLGSAMEFYQKLTTALEAGAEPDPTDRLDLARAFGDLARITREIGTGADALKAALHARDLYAQLVSQPWDEVVLARELADTLGLIGFQHEDLGHPDEALATFQDELAIRQALVRAHPDDPDDRRTRAGTCGNIGNLLDDTGRSPKPCNRTAGPWPSSMIWSPITPVTSPMKVNWPASSGISARSGPRPATPPRPADLRAVARDPTTARCGPPQR